LKLAIGNDEPQLIVRSKTHVDTGGWLWSSPLWVCVTDQNVVVMAASRRHFVHCEPISECQKSFYCHIGGELVILASEEFKFNRLRMSPVRGLSVIEAINKYPKLGNLQEEQQGQC
jgi:hypothetical protein